MYRPVERVVLQHRGVCYLGTIVRDVAVDRCSFSVCRAGSGMLIAVFKIYCSVAEGGTKLRAELIKVNYC